MTDLDYVPGSSAIPATAFGISPSQLARFFSKPHEWYSTEVLGNEGFTGSTSSYLGTIVHFIANEFARTRTVRKYQIYQYLFEQLVPETAQKRPIDSNEQFIFDEQLDIELIEDFLINNVDPEHIDVEYILNNYKPMGNALIQFLRTSGLPAQTEELISAEVIPNYYVCGSCDALRNKRRVVDYKTTSDLTAKSKIPYEYKLQLLCYAYIYRQMGYPIDSIAIVWITHNQINRISETNGKPLADYPTKVTEVIEYVDDQSFSFIESLLKLVAESVQATKDFPQLTHIIWKDYRLK